MCIFRKKKKIILRSKAHFNFYPSFFRRIPTNRPTILLLRLLKSTRHKIIIFRVIENTNRKINNMSWLDILIREDSIITVNSNRPIVIKNISIGFQRSCYIAFRVSNI